MGELYSFAFSKVVITMPDGSRLPFRLYVRDDNAGEGGDIGR